ncbi:lipopolysaccharide biosynthesis protein [Chondrinema litorale]|uniref:lipopolysaccharide biosynthesis protein n=1 Tax=Chondrinema litorale TaxID=2994555 RepID=UPI002542EE08|nr:lipopolysaccharide biosynthesis protein [Chondrinema litorale]UZR93200.1 lipopolysaccharide biosynthesis protein [Chondrinema litorale]
MSQNLASKTATGVKWSTISTVYSSALQIVYTSIMGHLLDSTSFGIVASAGVILRFGMYFAQMGMGQAIIQKKDLNVLEIRSAFTSSILLGGLFFLLTFLFADFSVVLLDNNQIIDVVRALSFNFILVGLSSTSLSLLKRELAFKKLAVIEVVSYTGYLIVGVGLAFNDFGVWSLVFATLCQSLMQTMGSYLTVRHNIKPFFDWNVYKPLFQFGSKVSIISFMEFIGSNMDTMLIGKLLNASLLGIYNRAFMLVNLPMRYITMSISKVLYPSLSRIQNESAKLKKIFLLTISVASILLFPISAGIFASAENIILTVLGEDWVQSIIILKILAFAAPLDLLSHFGGVFCEANNKLNPKIILQFSYLVLLATLFFLLKDYGIQGVAIGVLIGELSRFLAYMVVVGKMLHISFKEYLNILLSIVINIAFVTAVMLGISYSLDLVDIPILFKLLIQIASGAITVLLMLKIPNNQRLILSIRESNFNIPFLNKISSFLN